MSIVSPVVTAVVTSVVAPVVGVGGDLPTAIIGAWTGYIGCAGLDAVVTHLGIDVTHRGVTVTHNP